ncbi:DDE_3 domain-containing protein [Trichonephila clavipes]|nr:DDE_3 domain-containing protein [Trichonephila clavipes]
MEEKCVKKIRRESGAHYLPSNVQETDHYDSGGLMVWAGIKLDGHRHLFARDTVTAVKYRDEVLEPFVRFFPV